MCGIVGIVSYRPVQDRLLHGLELLEYRGYDSTGIAIYDQGVLQCVKSVGRVENLVHDVQSILGHTGIGHCRWATTGDVSNQNAHPHFDCSKKMAVIHNGIIENYAEIKEELIALGHIFTSETDTEVICHLVEQYYGNEGMLEAFKLALRRLKGSYAIVLMHVDYPSTLFVARNESPVALCIGDGENYVASDEHAFVGLTDKIYHLEDHEIAVVHKDRIFYYDLDGREFKRNTITVSTEVTTTEKGEYPTYMMKEIGEQSRVIESIYRANAHDLNLIRRLQSAQQIHLVACGTAYYAGLYGEYILEDLLGIPTKSFLASEYRYRHLTVNDKTVVIGISQSGETADTLGAIKRAKRSGAYTIGLLNVCKSNIGRTVDQIVPLMAGPEIGVASTKVYTAMLAQLLLLGLGAGVNATPQFKEKIAQQLSTMPDLIKTWLPKWKENIQQFIEYASVKNAIFMGRGFNLPTALEGALKLKEISYIHAEGYAGGELKHGPIALIDPNMLTIAIATKHSDIYSKMVSNIQEVKARKGIILVVAFEDDQEIDQYVSGKIIVPRVADMCSPIVNVIPLQLFAHEMATKLGRDVDKPRNLAKSVTVE